MNKMLYFTNEKEHEDVMRTLRHHLGKDFYKLKYEQTNNWEYIKRYYYLPGDSKPKFDKEGEYIGEIQNYLAAGYVENR